MTDKLSPLFAPRDLRNCSIAAMHVVMATRLNVLYDRCGRDPLPDLAVRLRSMRAAQAVAALCVTVDHIWPDSFAVHKPCCMKLSPDEAALADVATAAAIGDRDAAVAATREMMPLCAREKLFRNTLELVDAIHAAQLSAVRD
jgi:hypothetical protein